MSLSGTNAGVWQGWGVDELSQPNAPMNRRQGPVVGSAVNAQRLGQLAGLKLLRAELMPVLVAVLGPRFADRRIWPVGEFLTLLAEDLDDLRAAGFVLPRAFQEYLSEWIRDGMLIRRASQAREETVELSASASDALRFVRGLAMPQSTVTSSRLSNVAELLGALARDTDPVPASRLDALLAQRAVLDAEIAKIESGEYEPLSPVTALERLREILRLASEVPGDFAKVADELDRLNHALREQIINNASSRGAVLEKVFAGVDLIESSEAGRTFAAFHGLLLDPALADAFDAAVDAVLARAFATGLGHSEMTFLRHFLTGLQRDSEQVRQTLTSFSKSLRRFVETQEYREHKRLAEALSGAEAAVLAALRKSSSIRSVGYAIDLTSVPIASLGSWILHNPADVRTATEVAEHRTAELDIAELRAAVRLTEIDFSELQANIDETIAAQGTATIADVLDRFPATQGLASVVGLLVLAVAQATPATGWERWAWTSGTGRQRTVSGPRYVFSMRGDE